MTIVVTGGGSGGHITPILAVAHELKQLHPDLRIVYVGQKGDSLSDVPARDPNIDQVYGVSAGKFRRYHGEGLRQLLDVKTMLLNLRDVFRVLAGLYQSWRLLRRLKPAAIFVKGGFVGVPVGLAAAKLRIPFVTHDSDAIPGLANRIIGRWAKKHAVALPAETYNYKRSDTITVGIPLVKEYQLVTAAQKRQFRHDLQIAPAAKMLFIIGGGLGAQRINKAVLEVTPHLLLDFPGLQIKHVVGRANVDTMQTAYAAILSRSQAEQVKVLGFVHDVYRYSGAADVIITRAGATNLAEFAVQGKACIVIPSPFLTGGHQLKNAAYLKDQAAAEVLDEVDAQKHPDKLGALISQLLRDPARQQALGQKFTTFAHPDSAQELAKVILAEVRS